MWLSLGKLLHFTKTQPPHLSSRDSHTYHNGWLWEISGGIISLSYHLTDVCPLSCFSSVWYFAMLWTVAHQAPLSMGFFRQGYWSGYLTDSECEKNDFHNYKLFFKNVFLGNMEENLLANCQLVKYQYDKGPLSTCLIINHFLRVSF